MSLMMPVCSDECC